MSALQVAVLARAAVPGAAKTRLIPRLGAERAAALQAHLTERALQRARASDADVVLWFDGVPDESTLELARACNAELRAQPDGDLGTRMHAALVHAQQCHRIGIVIGTDCPAQQPEDIVRAGMLLASHDVVLQPALDGGYVLIGMRQPQHDLFSGIDWGTHTVLDTTRQRLQTLGLRHAEMKPLPDLDRPDDLDLALRNGWLERGTWS
jgi:uncharacterized protein